MLSGTYVLALAVFGRHNNAVKSAEKASDSMLTRGVYSNANEYADDLF